MKSQYLRPQVNKHSPFKTRTQRHLNGRCAALSKGTFIDTHNATLCCKVRFVKPIVAYYLPAS